MNAPKAGAQEGGQHDKIFGEYPMTTSKQIKIRKMEQGDAHACFRIVELNYNSEDAKLARSEMYYAHRGTEPQPHYFVADKNGQVVGLIGISSSFMNHRVYEVFWVNVHPDFKGNGIGSAMVKHVMNFAFNRNAESIMLTATDKLMGFYERLGFSHRGQIGHDNFDDNLMEAKPLLGVKG